MRRLVPLLLTLVLVAAAAVAGQGGDVVSRLVVENRTRVRDKEVLRLLGLRAGRPLDRREIERGLGLLARKVEVGEVRVEAEPGAGGETVTVTVLPRLLVRSVGVRGGPRRVRERAEARLRTVPDRPVVWPRIEKDRAEIREVFRREGYPEARVAPEIRPDGSGQWAEVVFRVEPGEPRRVVEVRWPPVFPVEPWRRTALLGLGRGDRASEPDLEAGVRRLVSFLRRNGYPEARAGSSRFVPADGGVRLTVGVIAGRPIRFRFEGVPEWRKGALRAALRERFGQPVDRAWLDAAAGAVAEVLRADGYRDVRVSPREDPAGDTGERVVTFQVEPGPRVSVKRVEFRGNETLSSRRLRRYMALVQGGVLRPPPFTQDALERDLRVLTEYYATKGFWDARVSLQEMTVDPGGAASLTLRVEEGTRYRWGEVSVRVSGDESFRAPVDRVRSGGWADAGELEEVRRELIQRLAEAGFPEGRVTYETRVRRKSGVVDVAFRVDTGPRIRFGKVVVSGNARTQTKVVRRELTFRPGAPWDPAAIRASRQRLYDLGFLRRVEVVPVPTLAPTGVRDVEVRVEEQDAGLFEFGLGYGTEEGVKGFMGLSHGNLGGYGRSLGGRYDFDRLERSLAVNFREPWLFNHPVDLRLSLVDRVSDLPAYHLNATALQVSLDKRLGPKARGSLVYTLESNRLTDLVPEAVEAGAPVTSYLLSSIGPFLAWDSRNDPFRPRRGFYHTLQAEWATDLLASEVQFERYTGTVSGYFSSGRFTLALLARGGLGLTRGKTAELPVNKRFYLGGRSTVRGFHRDAIGPRSADGSPLGGDVMVNLRAELRYRWRGAVGFAVFWDAGNVWNRSVEPPQYGELRQGAGVGFRYETPVGPLALDLGINLSPREDEDRTVWHFTVGNVF
ncbi:MAG: outer membrane protein assembly factor BamA [Deltaproteobacteria bacterium]|nr:outer membrane protein assembly factor BamA [Deltaproteobacteria bacterium]